MNKYSDKVGEAKRRLGIVGHSAGLTRAIEVALLIAPTDVSVLVTGESGVGKEAFPQLIHQNSIRKHGPYVAVNCGAIPEGTIDSELFGHKKGSFTDAVTERRGYFEVANGGTIFLDEVGELPLATQARLLRVLESGEFMKVGSSEVQRTDIRVVAATNVDLAEAVKRGRFRQDLLYRLNTVTIELPPLRERGDDISLLFRKFAGDFGDKYQMPPIRLSEDGRELLETYSWPGNIRELRNLVERLSVLVEDRVVTSEVLLAHLPTNALVRHPAIISDYYRGGDAPHQPNGQNFDNRTGGDTLENNATLGALYTMLRDVQGNVGELTQLLYRLLQSQHMATQPIQSLAAPAHNPITDLGIQEEESELTHAEDFHDLLEDGKVITLKEMEERYIDYVLKKNHGARRQTAEDLDISERTLYRKLNREG